MTKTERHDAIRARASQAIRDLYHNATPTWPDLDDSTCHAFWRWLDYAASDEIEYLNDGGPYGNDYRATLAAPCNAGRYKSTAAQARYVDKGFFF